MTEGRRLTVDLRGQLDQAGLDGLRDALGLHRRGRLTDREDWEFGFRVLTAEGEAPATLRLWRYEDDRWAVTLDAAGLAATDVLSWAERAEAAAAAAGLTVVERQLGTGGPALTRRLFVVLRGELDQRGLDALRRDLGLPPRGDLEDERAWEFGERQLDGSAVLRLTRLRPGSWAVAVEAAPTATIPPADLDRWAGRVADAARAAGLAPAAPVR
jgi:hypothetical protein